ncbi:accessory Sec system translocase SecA2 [Aquibacillus sediminis]|uniref:accessory Sec system translocase SecA2 n=1 Tax=Aquibacillus sediminis TaxID=2574734 RepID=UPI001108D02E|nr:accessory Sec system translocase SecA2 [Aquibacillus sediminis]
MKVFNKIAQIKEQRPLKRYHRIIDAINKKENEYAHLTDEQLQAKTEEFKGLLADGKTVDDIKVDAFAVVREASKRVLGLRHYDVQLLGGLVLLEGNISEMPTGEGKTLVASLPSYLRGLEGNGVHVITVNEYLARRDQSLIGKIHEYLGLTVGLNVPNLNPSQKKQAYQADITYGIGTEFGFDFLRDNMTYSIADKVQRPYHYAIIDEVDSVLIDEAKTPLIIAGKTMPSENLHNVCAKVTKKLKENKDFIYDDELKLVNLTEDGMTKVEKIFAIDNLFDLEHRSLNHYMTQALRARTMFERDVDYIVEDGAIKLVDMNTGRIMEGRSLSDGLHQALEAKEGLKITEENKAQASITIQNYFRMYPILSGMTGTAKTDEAELKSVYDMGVTPIPTNKSIIRDDQDDLYFVTKEQKYNRMIQEVLKRHQNGQPILIGTTSILQSETVAEYLDHYNLTYQLLNAKSVDQEAHLISLAGQKGQITIATNMAGRGTDIMLGEGVAELGGLHVLGTEKHESRRIDNQLKGRAGRQGDPGSSQFIISMEDELFTRYARDEIEKRQTKWNTTADGQITNKDMPKFVETVQKIGEGSHYQIREYNLKLDDVVNDQRKVIYTLRDRVLEADNIVSLVHQQVQHVPSVLVEKYCPDDLIKDEWPTTKLLKTLNEILLPDVTLDGEFESPDDVKQLIAPFLKEHEEVVSSYEGNEKLEKVLRHVTVATIDRHWIKHLEELNRLKEGIGLRQYQQEDPIQLYQKEGLTLFETMYHELEVECSYQLSKSIQTLIANK